MPQGFELMQLGSWNLSTKAVEVRLENQTDIHTLAKQLGNSALMIERHYSNLTATMAAEGLA